MKTKNNAGLATARTSAFAANEMQTGRGQDITAGCGHPWASVPLRNNLFRHDISMSRCDWELKDIKELISIAVIVLMVF